MSIHLYSKNDFYESLIDGRDTPTFCGKSAQPETRDGHLIDPPRNGKNFCGECIGALTPEQAAEWILSRSESRVTEAAQ